MIALISDPKFRFRNAANSTSSNELYASKLQECIEEGLCINHMSDPVNSGKCISFLMYYLIIFLCNSILTLGARVTFSSPKISLPFISTNTFCTLFSCAHPINSILGY